MTDRHLRNGVSTPRVRRSARLLIVDERARLLLIQHRHEAAGECAVFWATPGGELEEVESHQDAARRELAEETGMDVEVAGPHVASRDATIKLADGEVVRSEERYFLVNVVRQTLSTSGWTALERDVVCGWRWWTAEDLRRSAEDVRPANVLDMLIEAGVWARDREAFGESPGPCRDQAATVDGGQSS